MLPVLRLKPTPAPGRLPMSEMRRTCSRSSSARVMAAVVGPATSGDACGAPSTVMASRFTCAAAAYGAVPAGAGVAASNRVPAATPKRSQFIWRGTLSSCGATHGGAACLK